METDILAMPATVPAGRAGVLPPRQSQPSPGTRPDTVFAGHGDAIPAIPGAATRTAPDLLSTRSRRGSQAATFRWPGRWPDGWRSGAPRRATTSNPRPTWPLWRPPSRSTRPGTSTSRPYARHQIQGALCDVRREVLSRGPWPDARQGPRADRVEPRRESGSWILVPHPTHRSAPSWKTSRPCRSGSGSFPGLSPWRFATSTSTARPRRKPRRLIGCSPPTLSRLHKMPSPRPVLTEPGLAPRRRARDRWPRWPAALEDRLARLRPPGRRPATDRRAPSMNWWIEPTTWRCSASVSSG